MLRPLRFCVRQYIAAAIVFSAVFSHAQSLCGYVVDHATGERLVGVNIWHVPSQKGTTSDERGFFCISTREDPFWVFSMMGYKSDTLRALPSDKTLEIRLQPATYELMTIEVVQAHHQRNLLQGATRLSAQQLNAIPSVGGERDLVKAITTLPGISPAMEGFSNITVRGGGTDHNMFVADGVATYNSGHLFNFFSIFNPDAVKELSMHHSAFPARYGGRLASITEVSFRDGNSQQMQYKADLGIINSKLSVEGPLGNGGKTSFLFAARSTYLDLFTHKKLKRVKEAVIFEPLTFPESGMGYTFADLNLKLNHRFNASHWVFLSMYSGLDLYRIADYWVSEKRDYHMQRHNHLVSLKSHHLISNRLFAEALFSFNNHTNRTYEFEEFYIRDYIFVPPHGATERIVLDREVLNETFNGIRDFSGQVHFSYHTAQYGVVKGGLSMLHHTYRPVDYRRLWADEVAQMENIRLKDDPIKAFEPAAYISHETRLWGFADVMAGLRLSSFYQNNNWSFHPEPRISVAFPAFLQGTFNLSYAKMVQYNHALMKNEQLMSNTVWVPASNDIPEQQSHQYTLGYMKLWDETRYHFEARTYYKQMKNLVFLNNSMESPFAFYNWQELLMGGGKGRGYGIELFLARNLGQLRGNLNYSFSRHYRQFDALNNGQWHPYKYNREHVLNATGHWQLNNRWDLGFFWTLSSGTRFNLPNGYVNENPFGRHYFTYSGINNATLPAYHRLDLNANWTKEIREGYVLGLSFNVYNAYARKNPAYVYVGSVVDEFDENGQELSRRNVLKGTSYMPVIPSVNVSLKF